MEGKNQVSAVLQVRIRTGQSAVTVHCTGEAVHASVVVAAATPLAGVIRALRRVGQGPKVVIERMVFLHDDDDVLNLGDVAVGCGRDWGKQFQNQRQQKNRG